MSDIPQLERLLARAEAGPASRGAVIGQGIDGPRQGAGRQQIHGGTLKHQFLDKDNVLRRMIPVLPKR